MQAAFASVSAPVASPVVFSASQQPPYVDEEKLQREIQTVIEVEAERQGIDLAIDHEDDTEAAVVEKEAEDKDAISSGVDAQVDGKEDAPHINTVKDAESDIRSLQYELSKVARTFVHRLYTLYSIGLSSQDLEVKYGGGVANYYMASFYLPILYIILFILSVVPLIQNIDGTLQNDSAVNGYISSFSSLSYCSTAKGNPFSDVRLQYAFTFIAATVISVFPYIMRNKMAQASARRQLLKRGQPTLINGGAGDIQSPYMQMHHSSPHQTQSRLIFNPVMTNTAATSYSVAPVNANTSTAVVASPSSPTRAAIVNPILSSQSLSQLQPQSQNEYPVSFWYSNPSDFTVMVRKLRHDHTDPVSLAHYFQNMTASKVCAVTIILWSPNVEQSSKTRAELISKVAKIRIRKTAFAASSSMKGFLARVAANAVSTYETFTHSNINKNTNKLNVNNTAINQSVTNLSLTGTIDVVTQTNETTTNTNTNHNAHTKRESATKRVSLSKQQYGRLSASAFPQSLEWQRLCNEEDEFITAIHKAEQTLLDNRSVQCSGTAYVTFAHRSTTIRVLNMFTASPLWRLILYIFSCCACCCKRPPKYDGVHLAVEKAAMPSDILWVHLYRHLRSPIL